MNDEIKIGITWILITILIVVLVIVGQNKANSTIYTEEEKQFAEWISPDGVHYWIRQDGYEGYMAPRFDNNGNLVIDKEK